MSACCEKCAEAKQRATQYKQTKQRLMTPQATQILKIATTEANAAGELMVELSKQPFKKMENCQVLNA
jgi:hypothetical protein